MSGSAEGFPEGEIPARYKFFSPQAWRCYALFLLGAALIGVAATLFTWLEHWSGKYLDWANETSWVIPFVTAPLGLMLIIFIRDRVFDGTQGTGIPQTIAALKMPAGPTRRYLLSIRIAIGKFFLTALGLFCGASIGREGPTVQIGASILSSISHLAKFPRQLVERGLILGGGAAGIAASFNAPVAGTVFAFEEIGRSFEKHNASTIVLTVAISCQVVLWCLGGFYLFYGEVDTALVTVTGWAALLLIAVLLGALGGLFAKCLLFLAGRCVNLWVTHPYRMAGLLGLIIGLIGLASGGLSYGSGYEHAKQILIDGEQLPWFYPFTRMLATFATLMSGIPGGLFDPTLSAGAGFGQLFADWFPTVPPQAIILLAMVSFFSGVVQSPITSATILVEMTSAYEMILPLLIAAIIAYEFSHMICRNSLYEEISETFLRVFRERHGKEMAS
ncbi:MAG: chloride channel protein [Verrucomicrobiota bacterium JB024]|nr:chloride channel protein [Verrucomicrobiota bacterium JB024]